MASPVVKLCDMSVSRLAANPSRWDRSTTIIGPTSVGADSSGIQTPSRGSIVMMAMSAAALLQRGR